MSTMLFTTRLDPTCIDSERPYCALILFPAQPNVKLFGFFVDEEEAAQYVQQIFSPTFGQGEWLPAEAFTAEVEKRARVQHSGYYRKEK